MTKETSLPKRARSHLSVRELAERWGVSENFVRRQIWDGKLAHTRFGRTIRVPVAAADEYAARNTSGGTSN
jgi:excisionase family DNA binding protein